MGSSIPAVLDYLVAGLAALVDEQAAAVIDGQPVPGFQGDYIAVGYSPDPEAPAVDSEETAFYAPGVEENYQIYGEISASDGDADAKAARDTAFGLLDVVAAFVFADTTLGGLVLGARPLTKGLAQLQSGAGAQAILPFTIQIKALQK
jgi:hypothetical protein